METHRTIEARQRAKQRRIREARASKRERVQAKRARQLDVDMSDDTADEGVWVPAGRSAAEVLAYVEENPDALQAVRDLEAAGQGRKGLLRDLDKLIAGGA